MSSASPTTSVEGQPVARVGDAFTCPIHGMTTIDTGSPSWTVDGRAAARSGSSCGCGAVLIGGATKTFTD